MIPDATYLVTRRCYQRTFRLRPSGVTNAIFQYCLALALEKTGVRLHAACVMSDHHHLVVSDPRGVLPDFLRELHRSTAKALNASQGQSENLWAAEPPSAVRLATDYDVIDKIAYVVANPVDAGLVENPEDWPGLLRWGESKERVERAGVYFAELGRCPAQLELRVERPAAREDEDAEQDWDRRVARAIRARVLDARRSLYAAGLSFLGRAGVLAQSFVKRARSFEEKRTIVPRVAAKDPVVRRALLRIERGFREAYREALDTWRRGVRRVLFPFGTWWMRVHHRAAADAAPASGEWVT